MIEWDYQYIPFDPDTGAILRNENAEKVEKVLSDLRTEGWRLVKIIESRSQKHWLIVRKARWAHPSS
jgi:hypothetical protein